MITASEENYLKSVFKLSEKDKSVSTNDLAQSLGTTPASVSDMVKKLSEKKLLAHQPYKGVKLTQAGKKIALDIVRKHRLWEVFLTQTLEMKWDSVHEIAEQLEHIQSQDLIRKLDAFLGYPRFDPHGDPIPDENGKIEERKTILLGEAKKGAVLLLAGVLTDNSDFLQYLDQQQVRIGSRLTVLEILPFDKSVSLSTGKKQITFSALVCQQLLMMEEV
jgi:DtxR family Mn-dependent transcriptional regulator